MKELTLDDLERMILNEQDYAHNINLEHDKAVAVDGIKGIFRRLKERGNQLTKVGAMPKITEEEILDSLIDGCNLAINLLETLPKKTNKQLKRWLFNYIANNVGTLTSEYYYLFEIKKRL